MRRLVVAAALLLFVGGVSAQTQNSTESVDPGLVMAGGLLHSLDVAVDNALIAAGFRSPGAVAVERASEVAVAERRNNTRALQRASQRFNQAVQRADNTDRDSLQKAQQVLQNVSSRVPEEAQFGIETALENVQRAKQRVPEEFTAPGNGSGPLSDIKLPDGRNVDAPGQNGSER